VKFKNVSYTPLHKISYYYHCVALIEMQEMRVNSNSNYGGLAYIHTYTYPPIAINTQRIREPL
jgi:hypothetical protein